MAVLHDEAPHCFRKPGFTASVPIPKFAGIRGRHFANFGIDKDTRKHRRL